MISVIVGIPIVGIICIGIVMAFTAPNITDVEVSKSVYSDFKSATKTNLSLTKPIDFNFSARKGKTLIFVSGSLSQEEERTLKIIAERIQTNKNRKIELMFMGQH